jgi:signal transduction histidine kinase
LRSLSLRLALLYMALFTASVLVIGAVHYRITVHGPLLAVKERVRAEMRGLADLQRAEGTGALAQRLAQRASADGGRLPYHALIGAGGGVITANLPGWPREHADGWLRLDADQQDQGEQVDHEALTLDAMLEDGTRLLVGRDIEDIDELEEKLLTAVVGVVAATLVLGLIGGLLMSRAIGSRIATVTQAARRVMEGDLAGRIPLRGSGDDFDRLNATLNDMLARIGQLFESVRRVSDSVAHELRTPLSRLRARLEALRQAGAPLAPGQIDDAIEEIAGLEKTFDAVLRIARIEGGRHDSVTAAVDVSAMLRDAAELYGPAAEERSLRLEADIAVGLTVQGDRDLLFQSVCNLLDNAIKYTPPGGRVGLAARRDGGHVETIVTDTGPGIPAEHRPRVIERFFRVPATSGAPGAGLGLSLVAAVTDRHGGTLAFEDARPGLLVRWRIPSA